MPHGNEGGREHTQRKVGAWDPLGGRGERESARRGPRKTPGRQLGSRQREQPDQWKQVSEIQQTGLLKKRKEIDRILQGHLDNGEEFSKCISDKYVENKAKMAHFMVSLCIKQTLLLIWLKWLYKRVESTRGWEMCDCVIVCVCVGGGGEKSSPGRGASQLTNNTWNWQVKKGYCNKCEICGSKHLKNQRKEPKDRAAGNGREPWYKGLLFFIFACLWFIFLSPRTCIKCKLYAGLILKYLLKITKI